MKNSPQQAFIQAQTQATLAAKQAASKAQQLSFVRLISFFALIALAVLAGAEIHGAAAIPVIVLGLLGFNQLVGKQQALDARKLLCDRVVQLNARELAALEYDFSSVEGGEQYADFSHPYTGDLDVFGQKSVFQLTNQTSSLVGQRALASYMQTPLQNIKDLGLRQEAIQELGPLLDWRQNFLAHGAESPAKASALDNLRNWAAAPASFSQGWWPIILYGLSIFNVCWLVAFFYLPFFVAVLAYLPTIAILLRNKKHVDVIHQQTEAAVDLLQRYQGMLGDIEEATWTSSLLQDLKAQLVSSTGTTTSAAFGKLAFMSRQLAVRANPFVALLNLFSFWEIRYARQLEKWKGKYLVEEVSTAFPQALAFELPSEETADAHHTATLLDQWLLTLGAFDALVSFAGVHYRYPAWSFPKFEANGSLVGVGMNHPLLPPHKSVSNDFTSPAKAHIKLLTGSNMAGKSTFLRTVGLQIAMAHWGGVVPSKQISLPILRVYTSMRTQDNLHEGASAFYAELQRLRVVVEATKRGDNIYFLLDEILKGTNSQDRHAGGKALIEQLIREGAAGIVATHDLELGAMATDSDEVDNIRLEVETDKEGKLFFDYTVKSGLAQSRNASILMKQMGLGVK
ncbi:MAG: hypothetical protein AB8F78_16735 [Saprospiraceae bacterium]